MSFIGNVASHDGRKLPRKPHHIWDSTDQCSICGVWSPYGDAMTVRDYILQEGGPIFVAEAVERVVRSLEDRRGVFLSPCEWPCLGGDHRFAGESRVCQCGQLVEDDPATPQFVGEWD